MVLYLDIVIFKEFIMDAIIVITSIAVLKKKTNSKRIFLVCLIGTVDTIIDLFIKEFTLIVIFKKILIPILMIKILFETKDLKEFAKELFVFYTVSFIYGGIVTSFMYSKSLNYYLRKGINSYSNYSDIWTLIAVFLGAFLITKTFKMVTKNIRKDNLISKAEICINNEIIKTKILLDTGNLLKDPISKMPVVIVEKEILKKALYNIEEKKIYLIPYKTLIAENKVLFGIKPEYIKLDANDYVFKDVIIGLYDGKISQNNNYFGLAGIDFI